MILYILFIISIFFEDLVIPLGIKAWLINFSFLLCLVCIPFIIINYGKDIINYVVRLIKNSPFKCYVYFVIYLIFISCTYAIFGKVKFVSSLTVILLKFIIMLGISILVSSYISYKIIKPKLLIKILYISIFCMLLLGLFDFILTNINVLIGGERILSIFHTRDLILKGHYTPAFDPRYGFARFQNIYWEAGYCAEYIILTLPLIYYLSFSKCKILKNNLFDTIIKRTTLPMALLSVFLTFSPIWIIFSVILTVLYALPNILKIIKKSLKAFVIICFLVLSIFATVVMFNMQIQTVDSNNTAIKRVTDVTSNIFDVDKLIMAEQSLGTRICYAVNVVNLALKHPAFGVGYGNGGEIVRTYILQGKSSVIITYEVWYRLMNKPETLEHASLGFDLLLLYGLVGFVLFYGFIILTILRLHQLSKMLSGHDRVLLIGLSRVLICYIILTFYDFCIDTMFPIFLLGFSIGLIQYYTEQINCYSKMYKLTKREFESNDDK